MINVVEVFHCWQLGAHKGFLGVHATEHADRATKHEEVLDWEFHLNSTVVFDALCLFIKDPVPLGFRGIIAMLVAELIEFNLQVIFL